MKVGDPNVCRLPLSITANNRIKVSARSIYCKVPTHKLGELTFLRHSLATKQPASQPPTYMATHTTCQSASHSS